MATVLSSETLSYNSIPGQDKLYQNTNTESIFTFGDFRIDRNLELLRLQDDPRSLSFDRLQSLNNLQTPGFNAERVLYIQENDLNPDTRNPNSYSYYGSYYTRLARSINNIVDNFPYAILAYDSSGGNSIASYYNDEDSVLTYITLISSAFTNQGNIQFVSGNSISMLSSTTTNYNVYDNFDKFEIQLSSSTLNTSPSYPILSYGYSAVSNHFHLTFKIAGILTAATTSPIYIRPTKKRYFQYKRLLSNLEYQLLESGEWSVPNPSNDVFFNKKIEWPRTIDGFAPDSYGSTFDLYAQELLRYASLTDQIKTDWMVRTIIPENFLELDTDGQIYQKMIQVYAEEFDKIKVYIDNLAYAHSVNYQNSQTIPDKLLYRLSTLLGWSQPINFTDTDFFEFLAVEDESNKSLDDYSLDVWRRVLTNINWLYKRKGTRDALMFIFKLIGAPDCLVVFDEFVYKIQKNLSLITTGEDTIGIGPQDIFLLQQEAIGKVNLNGYINYSDSFLKFQEGGQGRGNGQEYIEQWRPEFDPIKTVDNLKVYTGNPMVFGTEDTMNSKEVFVGLDPAGGIECDSFEWYKIGFFYTGNTSVNLPQDYKLSNVNIIAPPEITGLTISQWLNFVYNNSIPVRTRKTDFEPSHNFYYPDLRKIYLTYYYWNVTGEISNQITFRKLEKFLGLIESKFGVYVEQLIPATTIFDGISTIYRNTVFNRQKFVYPKGINDGSEFQIKVPKQFFPQINGAVVTSQVNNTLTGSVVGGFVTINVNNNIAMSASTVQTTLNVQKPLNLTINAFSVQTNFLSANTLTSPKPLVLVGNIINFPLSGTPIGIPPSIPQQYTGNTASATFGPSLPAGGASSST